LHLLEELKERSEESIMLEREYRSVLAEVLRPEDNRFEDVSLRQFCCFTQDEIKKLVFNHSQINDKFSRAKVCRIYGKGQIHYGMTRIFPV
jgi:hypothetical protein